MKLYGFDRYADGIRRQTPRQLAYRLWNRTFRVWHLRPPHHAFDPTAFVHENAEIKLPPLKLERVASALAKLAGSAKQNRFAGVIGSDDDIQQQHNVQRLRGFVDEVVVPAITGDCSARNVMVATLQHWFTRTLGGERVMMDPFNTALRIREWVWTLLLTRDREDLTPALRAAMCWSLRQQADRLARHVEHESPGNHPLGCLLELWLAELAVGAGPGSSRTRRRAARFVAESARSFLSDGFHVELSTHYHVQALRFLEEFRAFSIHAGEHVPPQLHAIIRRARQPVAQLMCTNARPPVIGNQCHSFFEADLGDDVATIRHVGDEAAAPVTISAVLLAALGGRDLATDAQHGRQDTRVITYPDAGYIVARADRAPATLTLVVDAGPLGLASNPGHGHADQLSFLLYDGGDPLLIDPGSFRYDDRPLSLWFKTSQAHNTMWCEDWEQAVLWRCFRWASLPERPSVSIREHDRGVIIVAEARYGRFSRRIEHRRTFDLTNSGTLKIHDCLRGPGLDGRRSGVSFHFRPGLVLESLTTSHWRVQGSKRDIYFEVDAADWRITEHGEPVAQGYGRLGWGPVLRIETNGTAHPRRILTRIAAST